LNVTVPSFVYAGQTYTSLGVGSNGCLVVGGGVAADCSSTNQSLPDPNRPNQLLAPFWTDLNPAVGGAVRLGVFVDVNSTSGWIVVDWDSVPEYASTVTDQFEVWIGTGSVQDISFSYGTINGTGRNGNLTIGAENGCQGQNYYFQNYANVGAAALPVAGTELGVTSP
jgi:hypothetical protein